MSKWHKTEQPVDRALGDLERKIALLERQMREMGHDPRAKSTGAAPAPTLTAPPRRSVKKFVTEMLTPPTKRASAPVRPQRKDLFDTTADPMKELDPEPLAFATATANPPDLFAAAAAPAARSVSTVAEASEKLAHYLAAGSLKIPKPTLKRVQRETRNRFFVWVVAALAILWLIIAVIRG